MTSSDTVSHQPATAHPAPEYPRETLVTGIAHIGVGRFHRAHLAAYLDDLLRLDPDLPWAVRGICLRATDEPIWTGLADQQGLYTVTTRHSDGTLRTRVMGSIAEVVPGWRDPEAAIAAITDPDIRIVSLTVTEGGYNLDPESGAFLVMNPDVSSDLTSGSFTTWFAVLTEALRRRRDRGIGPLAVMSCDNVQSNGAIARHALLAFAGAKDPDLAAWIADQVDFPSTMVDRITPAEAESDRTELLTRTGLTDRVPVSCEPFRQFVVEDTFANGCPPWQQVGVTMVPDVLPYEQMKLRLLNAAHQVLAHFGLLLGYTHSAEAMADDRLRDLLAEFQAGEAIPTLNRIPGVDFDAYCATVRERFANPLIDDTLERIATSASVRIPTFLLPVVSDNLRNDRPITIGAATVAAWIRRLELNARSGGDPVPDENVLIVPHTNPRLEEVLNNQVFGALRHHVRFRQACASAYELLRTPNRGAAIATLLESASAASGRLAGSAL